MASDQPPGRSQLVRFRTDGAVLVAELLPHELMGDDTSGLAELVCSEVGSVTPAPSHVAVDLSRVDNMNSIAVSALLRTKAATEALGAELVVVAPTTAIRQLFSFMALDRAFRVVGAVEDVTAL